MPLKYRLLTSFLLLLGGFFSCSKKDTNPGAPYTLYAINGSANVKDYYGGTNNLLPLANSTVFISRDTAVKDTSVYFASAVTDKNGHFSFYLPGNDTAYKIFTTTRIKSSSSFSALYYGSAITKVPIDPNDTIQLVATIDTTLQNGLNLTAQDSAGERLPGATILLYSSKIVAIADSTFSGTGSIVMKFNSDSLGKALASQLPAGPIYINALLKIDGKTSLKETDTVVQNKSFGISTITLVLK